MGLFDFLNAPRFNRIDLASILNTMGTRVSFTPANPTVSAGTISGGSKSGDYSVVGGQVFFSILLDNQALSNSALVSFTLPFTPVGVRRAFDVAIYDGLWKSGRSHWDGAGSTANISYADGSNISAGTRAFIITGSFFK